MTLWYHKAGGFAAMVAMLLVVVLLFAACGTKAAPATTPPPPDVAVSSEPADTPAPAATPVSANPLGSDASSGGIDMMLGEATVEQIELQMMESFPVRVNVRAQGLLADGCTSIKGVEQVRDSQTFTVTIQTQRPRDRMCTQALKPFEHNVALEVVGLPAGTYTVNINGITDTFTLAMDNVAP